jgi:CHAT domain-containing protein/Tfp pilus assembly protein PilF
MQCFGEIGRTKTWEFMMIKRDCLLFVFLILLYAFFCPSTGLAETKQPYSYLKEGTRAFQSGQISRAIALWTEGKKSAEFWGEEEFLEHFSSRIAMANLLIAIGLDSYLKEGVNALESGQIKRAITIWIKGKTKVEEREEKGLNDDIEKYFEGLFKLRIGMAYNNLGRYYDARWYLMNVLGCAYRIRRKNKILERDLRLNSSLYSAIAELNLGWYDRALIGLEWAWKHCEIWDSAKKKAILVNKGMALMKIGQYEKALLSLKQAQELNGTGVKDSEDGDVLSSIASLYIQLGKYEKAILYYQKALEIYKEIHSLTSEARTLMYIGKVYQELLGQGETGLSCYQKALSICNIAEDLKGKRQALVNIGDYYKSSNMYNESLIYYKKADAITCRLGDFTGFALIESKMADAYLALDQHDKALKHLEKAVGLAAKAHNYVSAGGHLARLGDVYLRLGQTEKGLSYYKEASAVYKEFGDGKNAGYVLNNLGRAMFRAGEFTQAKLHFQSAIEAWESIRGQIKTSSERTGFQSTLPNTYSILATACLAQDDQISAFEAVERSRAKSFLDLLGTRSIGRQRSNRKTDKILTTERQLAGLREKQVELASSPVGSKTRSALKAVNQEISELDKKRLELIDQLRREDPELGALTVVDPIKLNEIQSLLPDRMALVEFFHPGKLNILGKEQNQLWVFAVHKKGLEFKAVDVPKSKLEKTLNEYAQFLSDEYSDRNAVKLTSHKLYEWLIKPVEPILERIKADTLVFVPWGPMFKIPFSTLAPEKSESLIASRNIVIAPSAGVYRFLKIKQASGRKKILAVGNPDTALNLLSGAEKEVAEVSKIFKKSIVRTRSQATESFIKSGYDALGNPDVVHFACHGIFNEKAPQLSHLALTPDQKNDGNLEMYEIFDLDWKGVSLVTLSSCSSGKGKLGAGNDLIGLTRGFMFAGAPAVLCSLWDVDDEATRALMKEFYSNYLNGMSKPGALRKAQESIKKMPKWSHPYYWSAFVLFGNWE